MKMTPKQIGFNYAWRRSTLELSYNHAEQFGTWYGAHYHEYVSVQAAWRAWRRKGGLN